ncbi:hypothetical protein ACFSVM_14220 [Paenibacillus shunpengii]|uniref:Uncharacterized protein n=1 Tax=Paenibacillus shunpengii TaxID=2054424 RepID=A0ABW5SQU9_9BACL|nr:hypothetical protein [Paenibacillus sp. PDC88]SDW58709.1 hypothetical protein SAMN05518848_102285 [Paenibacillus sp. PDC88]
MSHNQVRFAKGKLRVVVLGVLLLTLVMLTGCMYPGTSSESEAVIVNYDDSVNRIQNAIDSFQSDQHILPMITAGNETPRYEKFRIDLNKLEQQGYLDDIPNTAFEKGGSVYYLLQNEETDPVVKVMDLTTVQRVNDVQRSVQTYKSAHDEWPVSEEVSPGIFRVDLDKLQSGANQLQELKSVYSGEVLPYLLDDHGNVYADYAVDIMQVIEREQLAPSETEDLRELLTERSHHVPVKSLPYHWDGSAPLAVLE